MKADWLKIITAHVIWKQRLEQLLAGTSTEQLDPDVIAHDDRCDLGRWIYGPGKSLRGATSYATVKELHAHFHKTAASVVRHHLDGQTEAARDLLTGDYNRISDALKKNILRLRGEVDR